MDFDVVELVRKGKRLVAAVNSGAVNKAIGPAIELGEIMGAYGMSSTAGNDRKLEEWARAGVALEQYLPPILDVLESLDLFPRDKAQLVADIRSGLEAWIGDALEEVGDLLLDQTAPDCAKDREVFEAAIDRARDVAAKVLAIDPGERSAAPAKESIPVLGACAVCGAPDRLIGSDVAGCGMCPACYEAAAPLLGSGQ